MDFNKELEKEIKNYHETSEVEHFNNIVNLLPYCVLRTPTYLLKDPVLNKNSELVITRDNTLLFTIIEDSEGFKYIPVYTSQEEYNKMPNIKEASIYHLEFKHIYEIFKKESDILGIAINPVDQNIIIEKQIIYALEELRLITEKE